MTFRHSATLAGLGIATAVLVLGVGTSIPLMATAQSALGGVTGRVVWGTTCVPFPMPMVPGGAESSAPDGPPPAPAPQLGAAAPDSPQSQVAPGGAAPLRRGALPAGAVLVAVQGTSTSARTDENGMFTLGNVPAGEYLTVAAGPVSGVAAAWVARPNVLVNAGQTVNLGVLVLGSGTGGPCRALGAAQGDAAPNAPDASP